MELFLSSEFPYYECNDKISVVGFGRGYYIGYSSDEYIKLDLMYTDPFIGEIEVVDGIRMASVDDIIAMKVDVISRGGRKKDFWDLHFLSDYCTINTMLELHSKRYYWIHNEQEIRAKFLDFSIADDDLNPKCLLGKDWDIIKLDFVDLLEE